MYVHRSSIDGWSDQILVAVWNCNPRHCRRGGPAAQRSCRAAACHHASVEGLRPGTSLNLENLPAHFYTTHLLCCALDKPSVASLRVLLWRQDLPIERAESGRRVGAESVACSLGRVLGMPAAASVDEGRALWHPALHFIARHWLEARREKLQERLAKLSGGVAVLKVGPQRARDTERDISNCIADVSLGCLRLVPAMLCSCCNSLPQHSTGTLAHGSSRVDNQDGRFVQA